MSVDIQKSEYGYKGFFKLWVYHLQHRLFNGSWSPQMKREVFDRGHSVGVLIHDPVRDTVLLTEQFRLPAYLANQGGWQFDLVAGKQEEGEEAADVVQREAKEESGCEVTDLKHISTFMPSQGACTETIELYYAQTDLRGMAGNYGAEGEHEDIHTYVIPATQAFEMVRNGQIKAAVAVIGLQWLELHKCN